MGPEKYPLQQSIHLSTFYTLCLNGNRQIMSTLMVSTQRGLTVLLLSIDTHICHSKQLCSRNSACDHASFPNPKSYRPGGGKTICHTPTAVRLTADLHPSAARSADCTWLIVCVPDLQIWGIGTKHVNRFHYDFLLARYLQCPKMVDGQFFHIAKCHFGGHL